jgi:hypothetical protein
VGDSPVGENCWTLLGYLSRSSHVEPRLNLRGPSRKAKYYLKTDSKLVGRLKDEKNPGRGGTEPETMCLQAVGARKSDGVPFA